MDEPCSEYSADLCKRQGLTPKTNKFVFALDGTKLEGYVDFEDRAFIPLALKSFAMWATKGGERELARLLPSIEQLYELLLENRDLSMRQAVWDKYADGDTGYAIYYSERAIESLCRLHEFAEMIEKSGFGSLLAADTIEREWDSFWTFVGSEVKKVGHLGRRIQVLEERIGLLERHLDRQPQRDAEEWADPIELMHKTEECAAEAKALIRDGCFEEAIELLESTISEVGPSEVLAKELKKAREGQKTADIE